MIEADRLAMTQALENSLVGLLTVLEGIPEAQWHHKPEGGWSIGDVVEHLWIIEYGVSKVVIPRLLSEEAAAGPAPTPDAVLTERARDRSTKIEAPERVTPKGSSGTPDQAIAKLTDARQKLLAFVQSTDADFRAHQGPHPVFGLIDCCQWVLLAGAHMERHTAQIAEMKHT